MFKVRFISRDNFLLLLKDTFCSISYSYGWIFSISFLFLNFFWENIIWGKITVKESFVVCVRKLKVFSSVAKKQSGNTNNHCIFWKSFLSFFLFSWKGKLIEIFINLLLKTNKKWTKIFVDDWLLVMSMI